MNISEIVTRETENVIFDRHDINHYHHNPDNSITRKISSHGSEHRMGRTHEVVGLSSVNVEETIVYVLFVALVVFFFVYLVRCVRTTLDPYNTVARVAWFETLEKRESKMFQNIGLKAGHGPGP